MPNYYYLISSLPMLHFGARPPFSFENFLSLCQRFLGDKEQELLGKASLIGDYQDKTARPSQQNFQAFETGLRNELVKIRSLHKHLGPEKYLRSGGKAEIYITQIASSVHKSANVLETERILDQARWQELDELATGHYFDLDFLVVYALKLLILERWGKINTADRVKAQEEALQKIAKG